MEQERRWTHESALRMRYQSKHDPKGRGRYYVWEGRTGFGMRLWRSGRRTWACATTITNRMTGKRKSAFFTLGVVGVMSLKDARIAASEKLNSLRAGVDPRETETSSGEKQPSANLTNTSQREAMQYYIDHRNCAPVSKRDVKSLLSKNLSDWMERPLLSIDSIMLQKRYKLVLDRVRAKGTVLDARWAELPPEERLLRAPAGYHNGIKAALDTVKAFGRVYNYWVKMHRGQLELAGAVVPPCPTLALSDDLIPEPQRVKGMPTEDLKRLVQSFPTYEGNALHPLLVRFLLATGLRVGVVLSCKREYVQADRVVIPADAERAKVRWSKRHLSHLAKIVPITPEIESILKELARVGPEYGDAATWLFPSRTAESGHMEEEKAAALRLRAHAKVRFTVHQLRHNFATAAEQLGYSKTEIGELLGHATGSVTDRYIDERVKRYRDQLMAITAKLAETIGNVQRASTAVPIPQPSTQRRKATRGRKSKDKSTAQTSLPGL